MNSYVDRNDNSTFTWSGASWVVGFTGQPRIARPGLGYFWEPVGFLHCHLSGLTPQDRTQAQRDGERLSTRMEGLPGRSDTAVERQIVRWNSGRSFKHYGIYRMECMFGSRQTHAMSRGEWWNGFKDGLLTIGRTPKASE
jgi:hypothetical protein